MTQPVLTRRAVMTFAGSALATASVQAKCSRNPAVVCNVTGLYSVQTGGVHQALHADDVRRALRTWTGQVSIGGGRYSMGGQTAVTNGMQLDMRGMNGLVFLDTANKTVRVQAGMTWRQLQTHLDEVNLSVRTMQSYANFTVGGSISVNCHGRYVSHGPISSTVRALQLVTPYGEVIETRPDKSSDLFHAAIGGYGGVGAITEVELSLDDNHKIRREVTRVALEDYVDWFREHVQGNPAALLHNADLTPRGFDQPLATTWFRTDDPPTIQERLVPQGQMHTSERLGIWALTELPFGDHLRQRYERSRVDTPSVVWRNYEASLDTGQLEPYTRSVATYVLQEYFIPERQFLPYTRALSRLMRQTDHRTLNISIRHATADEQTVMSWAPQAMFTFVVYYKQRIDTQTQSAVGEWTRAMIDLALRHGGTYYLPYQLHATAAQFQKAYPRSHHFRQLRKELQAQRLTNMLWTQYNI